MLFHREEKRLLKWAALVLLLAATAPIAAFAAKGPLSEKAIPLFPGAKPFSEKEDREELAGSKREDPAVRSMSLEGYATTATPEEVVAWYRKQLTPTATQGADLSEGLRPGATSEVQEELSFYDFTQYDDPDGGKARRAKMEKDRKPYRPGAWIRSAEFLWAKRETNDDRTWFTVSIEDRSYRVDGSFGRKTAVTIQRITEKSLAALDEEEDEAMDREHAAWAQQLAGKSLDVAKLGIAVYPGAKHDARTTQGLRSSMGVDGAAYRTTDNLDKVAAFYKKQSGVRPLGDATRESAVFGFACKEEYIALLKKKMVTGCDINITVQNPWMDMATGNMVSDTLITVVRQTE